MPTAAADKGDAPFCQLVAVHIFSDVILWFEWWAGVYASSFRGKVDRDLGYESVVFSRVSVAEDFGESGYLTGS